MSNCLWCGTHDEDPEEHHRYWHLEFDSPLLLRRLPRRAVRPDETPNEAEDGAA